MEDLKYTFYVANFFNDNSLETASASLCPSQAFSSTGKVSHIEYDPIDIASETGDSLSAMNFFMYEVNAQNSNDGSGFVQYEYSVKNEATQTWGSWIPFEAGMLVTLPEAIRTIKIRVCLYSYNPYSTPIVSKDACLTCGHYILPCTYTSITGTVGNWNTAEIYMDSFFDEDKSEIDLFVSPDQDWSWRKMTDPVGLTSITASSSRYNGKAVNQYHYTMKLEVEKLEIVEISSTIDNLSEFFIITAAMCILAIIAVTRAIKSEKQLKAEEEYHERTARDYSLLHMHYEQLQEKYSKYDKIINAEAEAKRILNEAMKKSNALISQTNSEVQRVNSDIQQAKISSQRIIQEAQQKAREIAGNALDAKDNAKLYEQTAKSMKNIILGYGNDYLIPSHTLLDNLAETYGYSQASKDFKDIRAKIRSMIKNNQAATCDYSETNRRQTAISFITDAFNGKADSIITSAKHDNFGTLRQKLTDAFNLVNYNGMAFRNAHINDTYFQLRLEELRLACIIAEIHRRDIEEQRRIREQLREEEKSRREIEKALREAAKEEEMLQKTMEKAKAQLEKANAEQRAAYEAQIAELERKYHEAEELNKRALSMAQQTKAGHVYIISNEGSFGENIYKIGMTRRLEPIDRIRELSSASVPFPFDVHALIWSDDAPALETMLHKKFALSQVNKVNFRKEFFRLPLSEIRTELENCGLNVKWTISAEASEYRETLAIEKAIQDNPQAREDWLNHQLEFEINIGVLDEDSQEEE